MKPHLRLNTSSVAHPDAVVEGDRWRITVLTAGLLRLEWADDGVFEDRASTFAINRELPVPEFELTEGEAALELVTDRLRLAYDRGPFSPAGLSVTVRGNVSNYRGVWRYGEPALGDLGGTTRTLDDVERGHGQVAVQRERRSAVLEHAVLRPLEPHEAVREHRDPPPVARDDGLGVGER